MMSSMFWTTLARVAWNNKGAILALSLIASLLFLWNRTAHFKEKAILLEQEVKFLESDIEYLHKNIKRHVDALVKVQEVNSRLKESEVRLNQDLEELRSKFDRETRGKKSLDDLASKKTSLIEKKVNRGTKKTFECIEILSKGQKC